VASFLFLWLKFLETRAMNIHKIICLILSCFVVLSAEATDPPGQWRTPPPDQLIYLQLTTGTVIIELAPFMAAKNVNQFRALVNEGFYDGLDFYRVLDGFVAQGGDITQQKASGVNGKLPAEFTRTAPADSAFMLVQGAEFIAPQTGFLQGFAAGRDPNSKLEWLLHCPGVVAMGRNVAPDSAHSEFYITIGQAPRHLDRNMSVIGKVIYGMPSVQALKRAHMNNTSGVISDKQRRSKILRARLGTDVPPQERIAVQVQNERSAAVTQRLSSARSLDNEFYHFKGNGNLDICYYNLQTRVVE
jgi:peptidylprolyl isomerase